MTAMCTPHAVAKEEIIDVGIEKHNINEMEDDVGELISNNGISSKLIKYNQLEELFAEFGEIIYGS